MVTMNKVILFVLTIILALSFVSAAPSLSVGSSVTVLGAENTQRTTSFSVTNNGDSVLNNIVFAHNVRLSDGTRIMTLTFDPVSIATLNIGASQSVNLNVNIPDNMKLGTYSGIVNVSSGTTQTSFNLDIIIAPELCTDGPQGNGINIEIENPESGDGFKPGEKIDLSVNVENAGSSDEKFSVRAYLYNMDSGKKIAIADSDEVEIESDEDNTFDFSLLVPTDTKYLIDGDKYTLFVKAFEKGEEDNNCKEEYTALDLELEDEKAIIESVTFSPTTASCGDSITAAVKVRNIGLESLDDVRVEINNPDLKINKVSSFFDLDDYSETSDNNFLAEITFDIPKDAEDKEYDFSDINVVYSGGNSGLELLENIPKLIISGCSASSTNDGVATSGTQGSLSVSPGQSSVAVGSSLILNYALTNPTTSDASYTIDFVPNGNWANSVSQTVTVKAGQTYSGAITTLTNSVAQATYSGSVYVKSGANTIDQKSISIDLLNPNQVTGGATYVEKSLLDDLKIGNIPIAFWIIADLVLAFIILALVYIVYRR